MTRTFTGQITEFIEVADRFTVTGSVSEGARVLAGGQLIVQGQLCGELIVEAGGWIKVSGQVVGDVRLLGGRLLIAGQFDGRVVERTSGLLAVAANSIVNEKIVLIDGTVRPAEDHESLTITNAAPHYLGLREDGTWVPLGAVPES